MSQILTAEEVRKHNKDDSAWIIIHNNVYDVTKYLEEHPGGVEPLLEYAGQEGTQAFEDVGHSDDAREVMKKYKIGSLPENQQTSVVASCCRIRAHETRSKQAIACNTCTTKANVPLVQKESEKSWRTYDGSSGRNLIPEPLCKPSTEALEPKFERRIQAIVVPRERDGVPRNRRGSKGRRGSQPVPPQSRSNLKWYLMALAAALVVGYALKKKLG